MISFLIMNLRYMPISCFEEEQEGYLYHIDHLPNMVIYLNIHYERFQNIYSCV
jgi:hypothetical protein